MSAGHWELLPHFLLRSTGLPFAWLERLALQASPARVAAILDLEEEIETLTSLGLDALQEEQEPGTRPLRQYCWGRLTRRLPIQRSIDALPETLRTLLLRRDALLEQLSASRTAAGEIFLQEVAERRAVLRELAEQPLFQEAVWLSSPQMFQYGLQGYLQDWNPEKRPADVRRVERQLFSYLQRFCAKNETASFFGPLNYGDFSPPAGQSEGAPGAEHLLRREAFLAYWGVLDLAEALAADPALRPSLQPRLSPLCHCDLSTRRITLPGGRSSPLSAQEVQILQQVNGERTLQEIARAIQGTVETVWAGLGRLLQARLLGLRPEPPVTRVRPLEWLIDWVAQLPAACSSRTRWLNVLAGIKGLQESFARATFPQRREILAQLEEQMQALCGGPVRRGGGQMYADRLLLYEECVGGLSPLALGPNCAGELQRQLAPVLDLYAAHACAVHAQLTATGRALLLEHSPDGVLPWLDLLGKLRDRQVVIQLTPVQQALLSQLDGQAEQQVVEIDIPACLARVQASQGRQMLLTSPDVMLLARDRQAIWAGDFRVVLGECHDTLMIWGWATSFHSQSARVAEEAAAFLARVRGPQLLANVLASKRVKIVPFEYPGPTIEVATASEKPAYQRIPLAAVSTLLEDGQPRLQAPGWPGFTLYNGELPTLAHSLFAPPRVVPPQISLGRHTPRLTYQKIVLQREQWCLRREELLPGVYQGTSFALLLDVWRAARRLHLPRYLYARVKGERKPVLIDRANSFSLELLAYLLRAEEEITLVEALPGPQDLWLRDATGSYCAELRLSMGYVWQEEPS